MAGQVADVPERVGLALEQRDDDGAARGERQHGALEELDQQLLVVADLAVDVRALAADVREVEDDAVHHPRAVLALLVHEGRHLGRVDVVQHRAAFRLDLRDVFLHVRVLLYELVEGLLENGGGHVGAVVVLD